MSVETVRLVALGLAILAVLIDLYVLVTEIKMERDWKKWRNRKRKP